MPREKKIRIQAPFGQPRHVLFCDHFAINRGDDFTDLDFLCERSGQTLSIRMATDVVNGYRDRFVEYLTQTGIPETKAPRGVHITPGTIVAADILGLARHGITAEFAFHAVSWQCALEGPPGDEDDEDDSETTSNRAAYYVASVRCTLDVQLHWIGQLFEI